MEPVQFKGRVYTPGAVSGRGLLTVSTGELTLRLGRVASVFTGTDRIDHREPVVTLLRIRLGPIWGSFGLLVEDGSVAALFWPYFTPRDEVESALRLGGFEIESRRIWFPRAQVLLRRANYGRHSKARDGRSPER